MTPQLIYNQSIEESDIHNLCRDLEQYSAIEPKYYERFDVKRGLRNADGSGVIAGITRICNVHGYVMNEGERQPIPGQLIYRGYDINDLIENAEREDRYVFEEVVYLLLFGMLPDAKELEIMTRSLSARRELPPGFLVDSIMQSPSNNIMNKLARSILSLIRNDRVYTKEEAQLLDVLLAIHADHGGGNNSTFACRVATSSGTDPFAAYTSAINSLKGPRHGGANIKVIQMLDDIKAHVKHWEDEGEVADYLTKILRKEANDGSGLIYGMGHAVYTLSDPRAVILKRKAMALAEGKEIEREFRLLDLIEKLTPELMRTVRGSDKVVCANVDMYSGLVYRMLGIPDELFTPLFATARMVGWSAHRMEEILTGKRIIRPAYKAIAKPKEYVPLCDRD